MTVTEVTTSIAVIGVVAATALLVSSRSFLRPAARRHGGGFTIAPPAVLDGRTTGPQAGLRRSGRAGGRLVALVVVAVVSGTAIGLGLSLFIIVLRGVAGLGGG